MGFVVIVLFKLNTCDKSTKKETTYMNTKRKRLRRHAQDSFVVGTRQSRCIWSYLLFVTTMHLASFWHWKTLPKTLCPLVKSFLGHIWFFFVLRKSYMLLFEKGKLWILENFWHFAGMPFYQNWQIEGLHLEIHGTSNGT